MQIAGNPCFVCGQNIGVMFDGAGCVTCQIVVHRTCIGNQGCPKCQKPLWTAERVHSAPSSSSLSDRPISVTVLAWLTFFGALRSGIGAAEGFQLMATDESAGAALVAETVLQGILALALGFGLLNGYDWARRLYLWASPIFIMLALVLGKTSAELPGQWPMFSVALVAYAVWAYFLTRPKAVAFFHKQSRKPVTV